MGRIVQTSDYANFSQRGHDIIKSGFTPVAGRTYFRMTVLTTATGSYDDAAGDTHDLADVPAGFSCDISGVPTVASGSVMAFIDER